MKIDRIDVYLVAMPLCKPWTTAYGSDPDIEAVLVKMTSGEHEAWGESVPFSAPCFSPEYALGAYYVVKDHMLDCLLGKDIRSGQELQKALAHFKGNQFAKAALDCAWWGLLSAMTGKPIYQLIGGVSDEVEIGRTLSLGQWDNGKGVEKLLATIQGAIDQGFRRVKLKFIKDNGIEMLQAVRERFPDLTLHVDCNSSLTLEHDTEMLKSLDQFNMFMVEQPLAHDDLLDHAALRSLISTRVCLDESLNSVSRARQAATIQAADIFNLKPGRAGGITPCLEIAAVAREHNIPCWVGGMLESGIGLEFLIALGTLDVCQRPMSEGGYPNDVLVEPAGGWAEGNLCSGEAGQTEAERLHRVPGKGLCVTATGTPHCAAPDPQKMIEFLLLHDFKVAPGSASVSLPPTDVSSKMESVRAISSVHSM